MLFIVICILLYYFTIFFKKQHLKIYKYSNNNFITNTFIQLSKNIDMNNIDTNLKLRISKIYKLIDIDYDILYINSLEKLFNEIYTKKKFIFRILIFNYNQTLIIFQNHRSLCNGQERIHDIISYIIDSDKYKTKNKNDKFLFQNKISNLSNELYNGLKDNKNLKFLLKKNIFINNLFSLKKNNKLISLSKQFKLKIYDLQKLKKFCKKINITLNDFGIAYSVFYLISDKNFTKEYISVFVPIFFNGDYIYSLLKVKNVKQPFIELLIYVSQLCKYIVRNPLIKIHSSINLRLLELYPYSVYSKLYNKTIEKVDIFISNIVGFYNQRTFLGVKITNIYHMYNSYNTPIEAGISSYNNIFYITLSIREDYVNNFKNLFSDTL